MINTKIIKRNIILLRVFAEYFIKLFVDKYLRIFIQKCEDSLEKSHLNQSK